jgi:hypothetical protein
MLRWAGIVAAILLSIAFAAVIFSSLRPIEEIGRPASDNVPLPPSISPHKPPPAGEVTPAPPGALPSALPPASDGQGAPAPTASDAERTSEEGAPPTSCLDLGVVGACIDKDTVLAGLKTAPYAFNAIEQMQVGHHYGMSLVIDPSRSADLKNALASSQGRFVEGTTKIALRMEAELSGATFTIEPKGRVERELSKLNPTRWDWDVIPTSAGNWPLQLSMYVILLGADGKKISEDNPLVERRTIAVSVTWTDRVTNFVKTVQPIWAFAAAVIAGVVGAITWLAAGKRKGQAPSDAPRPGKSGAAERKNKKKTPRPPT